MNTETEVILKARDAFKERDRVARELQEIDNEIKDLVKAYSLAAKIWGFTPIMLRQAVRARLGEAA
jgi:archaellum component FlaC